MSGFKGEPVKKINPYVGIHWEKCSMIIQDNMCCKEESAISSKLGARILFLKRVVGKSLYFM